ncbi:cytochrome P450 [Kutzneria viridogrisea]|uniref:Cytochrome P450 n=2 Tax=Kutzneria TaxID=43356 RepID=W5W6C1_9PSEU|nr:cytochrome P450 [Kutzneria albida]AHH96457.1 cytochrome P450 [Kutzneria albida DSM 43870]MBA8928325.1 P450-derived glycosyltransferase activator [Kutzneria viridogrisea]
MGDRRLAATLFASRVVAGIFGALGDPLARLVRDTGSADPYPIYESIRARGVLVPSRLGPLMTASHPLANSVLRDARFGVMPNSEMTGLDLDLRGHGPLPVVDPIEGSFLMRNPPDHTRLRRLAAPSFSPRALREQTEIVESVVAGFLDELAERPSFDLVTDFAARVPIKVICGLLGASDAEHARMMDWGTTLAGAIDGVRTMRQVHTLRRTLVELNEFLTEVAEDHRARPREDVVSHLLADPDLSREDLLATSGLLLAAGFETTVNLIGNGVLALLANPEAKRRLIEDPDCAPNVVEEVLRLDPPAQFSGRTALEPVELAGRVVPKGTPVILLLAAANRDPEVFADPHRFDIDRPNAKDHLAFSSGIHYCLGASLARMEGAIALRALFTRLPGLRLVGPVRRRPSRAIRGPLRMPVTARTRSTVA